MTTRCIPLSLNEHRDIVPAVHWYVLSPLDEHGDVDMGVFHSGLFTTHKEAE